MKTTIIKSPNAILGSRKFTIDVKKKPTKSISAGFKITNYDL